MINRPDCKSCIGKCPQADLAHSIALDRMHKTQLLVEYIEIGTTDELRAAKKKQTPERPNVTKNAYGFIFYKCSSCFHEVGVPSKRPFCDMCGQALDWRTLHE